MYVCMYCLTVRIRVPLHSRKGQRDSRDPSVHHPKAQSQSHSNVEKRTGGQTSPPSFVPTADPPVPSLRGWRKPLYNNNISGGVSAATTVAFAATLLLVRCGCAVTVCEKKEAGTSAVHEPHGGLATPTHPPTPPLPPTPPPLPLPPLPPRIGWTCPGRWHPTRPGRPQQLCRTGRTCNRSPGTCGGTTRRECKTSGAQSGGAGDTTRDSVRNEYDARHTFCTQL